MTKRWYEYLMDDHTMTEKVFAAMESVLASPAGPTRAMVSEALDYVTNYVDRCHTLKEERHLFPLIQERGVPAEGGPLGVMLAEHEEQKRLLAIIQEQGGAFIGGTDAALGAFKTAFVEYATLCKQHFWKENDILYPMSMRVLSEADEQGIVDGIHAVEAELGEMTREKYYALAEKIAADAELKDLSHAVPRDIMAALLNTLPVELSFVDVDDKVLYFSHEDHDKIFPRQRSAIGTDVRNCHPPESLPMVMKILKAFKEGEREVAEFWLPFREMMVHVRYFPVRSKSGEYLGCLEVVQDVTAIQKLEGQQRLLDWA